MMSETQEVKMKMLIVCFVALVMLHAAAVVHSKEIVIEEVKETIYKAKEYKEPSPPVHMFEIWLDSLEDARALLPQIVKLGSYSNIYNVKWFSNSECLQDQVVVYIFTDDVKFFNSINGAQERPELRWLKSALECKESSLIKIKRLLYNSMSSWDASKSPMKDALTIADVDLRSLMLEDMVKLEKDEYDTREAKVSDQQDHFKFLKEVHQHLQSSSRAVDCTKMKQKCEITFNWMDCTYYQIMCGGGRQ